MPSGAAPGERRGGREVGTKNKATLEKERIAAEIATRTIADARTQGKKLAKEVLEEFMFLFAGLAARHQPMPIGSTAPPGREPNPAEFEKYARLAMDASAKLAPFQSPTFRAIAVTTMPGMPGEPAPKTIEGTVIDINDPKVVQRAYLKMVSAGK